MAVSHSIITIKTTVIAVCLMLGACTHGIFEADTKNMTVSDWMEVAAKERVDWFERTAEAPRPDAVVALAMFEAANAVEQNFPSYLGLSPADQNIPLDLTISVAASEALTRLYPDQSERFDEMLSSAAFRAHDPEARQRATMLGQQAARAAFERGGEMTSQSQSPYRTMAPAGVYVPTETITAISDFDLVIQPWTLATSHEARPPAPPSLSSKAYMDDLAEVQALGAKNSTMRTTEQTETAWFWFFIDMNPILREIAEADGRTASQNARMYAMFYQATDDSWTASADAKNHYQLWRPITAIRQSDRDQNDETKPAAYWSALIPTPPHPEYPCAHCVQAAAQVVILSREIDDIDRMFEIKSSTLPNAMARTLSLQGYIEQTSLSRIYAGAHYRFSNQAGEATGAIVGQRVLERWAVTDE